METDLPARRYSIEPIVLRPDIVKAFSRPDALPLFDAPAGGESVGHLGAEFRAVESRSDAVYVRPVAGAPGWLRLQQLADARGEVVDFVSGLVRIYRADWRGAADLLGRVVESPSTPSALRLDAALLRARAKLEAGDDLEGIVREVDQAASVSPYARRAVMYQAVVRLIALRGSPVCERKPKLQALRQWLADRSMPFVAGDAWLQQFIDVVEFGERRCDR